MKDHILKLMAAGHRIDGRKPDEYRKLEIETGVVPTAEGSARVKLGETEILVGIKLEVIKPYPDNPDQGSIMVNAELLPLSSPEFESGPPSIVAIELARVVDRGIRESHAVDFKALCIEPGEKAWMVIIDICPLNAAGNLFDAAALGAMAALKNAVFPEYDGVKVSYDKKTTKKLPLTCDTVACTVLKLGNQFIVDPLPEEEKAADARLSVASLDDQHICAMQKGGETPFTLEEVDKIVGMALQKCVELRKLL